ncbi:MFS transporter [Roseovarius aestuarii]|uniref:Putative MFS-type transporter YcaD n=1 Tax=Roseovarius aestuarii TaxID=475083 RepID=A0A1X7BWA9_9RHOB|nr:MFS transporter [Roseovarius aestuarii]SMC13795.1 putative MFS-type transporter YcaD [Roseovarius aestuarii]
MTNRYRDAFGKHVWNARYLFGAVPLFAVGTGALYPLIALELFSNGYGNALIGVMTSAWYLGAFLGTVLGGRVIYRLGYHRAFVAAAAIAAVSVWGLTLSDSPVLWICLRFIGGIGLGTYYLLMDSWISGLATPNTRGRMLAAYEAMRTGAVAVGPVLLVVASSHTAFALIGVLFLFGIVPVTKANSPTTRFDNTNWRDAVAIFVCSPCSLALTVIAGLLSSSFYGLGTIYAEGHGFSTAEIALFVSLVLIAPAISQLPIGTLADWYGRAQIGTLISLLALVCASVLSFQSLNSFVAVTIAAVLVNGLGQPLYALGHGRLVDGGHELISATTAGLLGYSLGTFIGPIGAAIAMNHGGPAGLYHWISLCLAVSGVTTLMALLNTRRRCCPL